MQEVLEFLQKAKTYFIATADGDQPRVRPFGAIMPYNGKLYFATGRRKAVYHQLEMNPKLEICTYGDGEWLRLTGEAVFEDNDEVRRLMSEGAPERAKMFRQMSMENRIKFLEENPGQKNMLSLEDEPSMVFYLKNAIANFYSLREETKTVMF